MALKEAGKVVAASARRGFSFRAFTAAINVQPGPVSVMVRATSKAGEMQVDKLKFNPSGYRNNVIQTLAATIA